MMTAGLAFVLVAAVLLVVENGTAADAVLFDAWYSSTDDITHATHWQRMEDYVRDHGEIRLYRRNCHTRHVRLPELETPEAMAAWREEIFDWVEEADGHACQIQPMKPSDRGTNTAINTSI